MVASFASRTLAFSLMFAGVVMIITANVRRCPPSTVEYRYLPRDYDLYMKDSEDVGAHFTQLFSSSESHPIFGK